MSTLKRIKGLLKTLPEKDRELAKEFLEVMNMDSLQELVSSAYYKAKKRGEEISELQKLYSEIINYTMLNEFI